MGSADGTSISTNHLAYRWKVEIKMRESIKEEGGNKIRGLKKTKGRKGEKQNIIPESNL